MSTLNWSQLVSPGSSMSTASLPGARVKAEGKSRKLRGLSVPEVSAGPFVDLDCSLRVTSLASV